MFSFPTRIFLQGRPQFDNFVATGGTVSCHSDNLRCHQWRQSCQSDGLLFLVGDPGFATDCRSSVWCHGLITCPLYVGPFFGNLVLNDSRFVSLTWGKPTFLLVLIVSFYAWLFDCMLCNGWVFFWYIRESEVHGANMGPIWVLSSPDGPHVGPMNLAIRDVVLVIIHSECNTRLNGAVPTAGIALGSRG